ncbi:PTS sugar transporter subunit IIA [Lysinibacter sp. HNR]|uniref:PTS sugar transporter subunit IIA n=1 Tax=Lysinibacter sp. HNR TaxID=3031408 RepID=UPI002434BE4E|nr:PTS sugar transporter subunit IIA [Lysinibacter sp. HNR]WGD36725.1 PTS sugar transporter subunit IIA [Lysinibacter sp. HNR]
MSSDILNTRVIRVPGTATTRDEAIREVGNILVESGAVLPAYVDAMFDREASVSTYMGNFLAIPHGTNEAKETIVRSGLSVIRYEKPIDWDGHEVRFVVGIAGIGDEHLEILSKIAIVFSDETDVQKLIDAADSAEIFALLEDVNE